MSTQAPVASHDVDTFEEYTLFSLERSTPTLLSLMERSKRVATYWPQVGAMVEAAGMCQEVAAMASFQMTLDGIFQFGERDGALREQWTSMRDRLQQVMERLEKTLTLNEPGPVKGLFAVELPETLNQFVEVIPLVAEHIRGTYVAETNDSRPLGDGGNG